MRRRTVLGGGAGLAAGAGLGGAAATGLLGLFADPGAVRALGAAFVAGFQTAPTAAALEAAVWDGLVGDGALRERVAAAVRLDFTAGRVEWVDGWVLSRTEAYLCGLIAVS